MSIMSFRYNNGGPLGMMSIMWSFRYDVDNAGPLGMMSIMVVL